MSSFGEILKSLRPTRTNRFRVILLCIAAATTFWFLNAMNKQHTATLNYPIQFVYDKSRYIEVEDLPTQVAINVNGVGWNLLRNNLGIKTSPLLIPLDNPAEIKGLSAISIPSLISDQISELQLNYVLTDTLHIDLDERATKVFQLFVDSVNVPLEEGYRLTSRIQISPDSVIFHGPRTYLENMSDSLYLRLGEDQISNDFEQNISVPVPQKVTSSDPPIVQVSFTTGEYEQREYDLPLNLINGDENDSLFTDVTVRISFSVESDRADMIEPGDFTMVGDLSAMGEDSTIIPRLASYPLGLADISYDSSAVSVRDER